MTDDDINTPSEAEINTKNVPKKSPRRKRDLLAPKKVIEIAVFVDDELYKKTVSDAGSKADPVEAIQNLVFAYMNSVQLIYQSDSLDTKFQIILVRLEIFKKENKGINKKGGDIEGYLEEFCRWQSKQNPKTSSHPDHWDHGLLLTGVNLYDGLKKYSSVIGLAWVSGMCHPEYSCTINEGHNFESVYVIAHEMGHNLGMNHDGESNSGNHCDSNKYLMSPVLGPGKVTWSSCSNKELQQFLTARSTKTQASCLNDVPTTVARYDFLKEGQRPGEQYNALEQCQQSFGSNFVPHVKPKEPPFEDLCRELWCSNETHALRAHPALEGTDCSAKPYPYGSFCIEGECVPFYPDDVKPITEPDNNDIDENNNNRQGGGVNDQAPYNEVNVDGRPLWFDPIFLEVFEELKLRLEERFGT